MAARLLVLILLAAVASCKSVQQRHTLENESPSWAADAVWYQIFPERFRNGDTTNDPRLSDLEGSWPHFKPEEWHVSPWTSDWYRLQPWEERNGKGFYFNAQLRRYGGDLQGIIDELPYLSGLGINSIYLNPVFQSPSLHKYDASMYHHIDKTFGPNPAEDERITAKEDPADPATWRWTSADSLFLRLVHEAHARKMHIIIDGVFNHVGMTFWAFRDVVRRQQQSRFKDWFTILQWDDPSTPANEFKYKCWYDVPELPELRKTADGMASGPAEHIHAVVRRWMDPNGDGDPSDGIDGWRLDAADKVPMGFWKEFRRWVRAVNPDAYITGEIYWEDWGNDKMFDPAPWLQGDAFDGVMNYRWAREVCHFFIDRKMKTDPAQFITALDALRLGYPPGRSAVLMNLIDSHDTDRLLSHIINPDLPYDHRVGLSDNRSYDVRKPDAAARTVAKLMVLYQMTSLGAPMVYYGDEVGMWGGDDPDERKPMVWADLRYDDEVSHPFGGPHTADRVEVDTNLLAWYKALIHLRTSHQALSTGSTRTLLTDGPRDVLAYERAAAGEVIIVAINNSSSAQEVRLPVKEIGGRWWGDLLNGGRFEVERDTLAARIPPKEGMIFGKEENR